MQHAQNPRGVADQQYAERLAQPVSPVRQLWQQEVGDREDRQPNDLDRYEGRYGIEDTRMALIEAQQQGIHPFCVTIDDKANDYLPYIFGKSSYVFVRNANELPYKLPKLYLKLTS